VEHQPRPCGDAGMGRAIMTTTPGGPGVNRSRAGRHVAQCVVAFVFVDGAKLTVAVEISSDAYWQTRLRSADCVHDGEVVRAEPEIRPLNPVIEIASVPTRTPVALPRHGTSGQRRPAQTTIIDADDH